MKTVHQISLLPLLMLRWLRATAVHTPLMAFLFTAATAWADVRPVQISIQCPDVVLAWPSQPGETFTVQHRPTLDTSTPWTTLTNLLHAAAGANATTFVHPNMVECPQAGGGAALAFGEGPQALSPTARTEEQRAKEREERRQQADAIAKYLQKLLMEAVARTEADRERWKIEGRPALESERDGEVLASPQGAQMQNAASMGFYRVFKTSPTANADFFAVGQDSGANQLGIFDNDSDPDDDVFLLSNVTSASHATLQYSDNAITFRYTPQSGFFGTDTFTYTITNLTGGRATATAMLFVSQGGNNPPTAPPASVTLATNTYVATLDPLAGASDPDSDSVTFVALTTPRLGIVSTVAGQLQYTHPSNSFGADSFDYFLTDGRGGLTRVHVMIDQADGENDGMADEWEMLVGLSPTANDANDDQDGDGLPNLAEYKLGTDPRVAGNPLAFDNITAGQSFSNYARIPLSLIAPIEKWPVSLLANGASTIAFLQQGADGGWYFTWDTGYLPSGDYSLEASFQFNPDAQPPTPGSIVGPAKTVSVNNEVVFNQINSEFSDVWLIDISFPYASADFRIELYDEDGSGLVYFEGAVPDGNVQGGWDLTFGGQQISFGNLMAAVYAAPAGQGLPPLGQQAAAKAKRWFAKQNPGGIGDKFVVAWGWDNYSSSFNSQRDNLMLDGVINLIGNPALPDEYLLLPAANIPFGGAFRYDTEKDKETLMMALASPDAGNFFWFGHGSTDTIQGNAKKSSIPSVDVEQWLQNKKHRSKPPKYSYNNKHPYRLVILNGCDTYSDEWAHSFGLDFSPTGTTNDVLAYIRQGRQPHAFVGWTASVEVPGSSSSSLHTKYAEGLAYLFANWMSGFSLENCLQQYQTIMAVNGFANHNSWRISGAALMFRGVP